MAELIGKTIAELPEDASLSGSELFPVMDGSSSKRVSMSTIRGQFSMVVPGIRVEADTNIDEMLTPGTYFVATLSNISAGAPPPTNGYSYRLTIFHAFTGAGSTKRVWQVAQVMNASCFEFRRNYNGTEWGDWVRTANMNDVSPLAEQLGSVSMLQMTVPYGSSENIEVANGTHGLLTISGYTANLKGQYIVFCSNSGEVSVKAIADAPTITLTSSANTLTIANGSTAYGAYCLFVKF